MKLDSIETPTSQKVMEAWVCPACGGALIEEGDSLGCPECGERWPVLDGVPHFVGDFAYWGEVSQEQMRAVNRAARAGYWRAALCDSPEAEVRRAAGMILNLDRANWHWLTDLSPDARALDLGAGCGTTSHALAGYYREVVAVEPVFERVEFMRHRFEQENLTNVKVVRTSLWKLPFAPESFDLVAMNGVLEWVAAGREGDPRDVQLSALRKAHEVLRPGGCLYVGIENRTAAGAFIGYPDPHCGLPFVTILPRPLAHWYARRRNHAGGYRNYLYTSRGYRKLLREAGFRRVEIYLAAPSYNHPRFLIPLESDLYAYYQRNFTTPPGGVRGLLKELLLRSKVLKFFEYSFAILAHK